MAPGDRTGEGRRSLRGEPGGDVQGRGPPLARGLGRLGRAVGALLPPACVACGRGLEGRGAPVCPLCWHRLPPLVPPWCSGCGATRPEGLAAGACAECEGWPDGLGPAAAPYRMEEGTVRIVHALKYHGWEALAGPMGRAMAPAARRLVSAGARPPALVPVPLSPSRLRERGFNQAGLLARQLAAATGWPVVEVLGRRGGGKRQVHLGRRGRRRNVRELFRVVDSGTGAAGWAVKTRSAGEDPRADEVGEAAGRCALPVREVLLVDDVVTTGATAAACSHALRKAGLRCVGVVSFARAVHRVGP